MVRPLLGAETTIIAAQNGIPWWYFHRLSSKYEGYRIASVDPDGAVSAALPVRRAIGCVVYAATEISSPGVVRHLEGTRFSIGEPDGTISQRCTEFSGAMIAGGLKCPVETDLRRDTRETIEVATLLGTHPEISIERRLAGAERAGAHKTSTLQDLERGKPLELDAILKAVVELADLTGAEVSTLRAINALADLLDAQTGVSP